MMMSEDEIVAALLAAAIIETILQNSRIRAAPRGNRKRFHAPSPAQTPHHPK